MTKSRGTALSRSRGIVSVLAFLLPLSARATHFLNGFLSDGVHFPAWFQDVNVNVGHDLVQGLVQVLCVTSVEILVLANGFTFPLLRS
jgi:hypothetical protein